MEKEISEGKLNKYFEVTESALAEVKKHIIAGKEKEAKEIIEMAENYLSDAHHFKDKGDRVNAFAALNYAHGWLDAGARLEIFDVHDNKLFTVS